MEETEGRASEENLFLPQQYLHEQLLGWETVRRNPFKFGKCWLSGQRGKGQGLCKTW